MTTTQSPVDELRADMRRAALSDPGQDGLPFATSTLWAAVQWLNGHEVAPAHRCTSQAIRFIIDGAGSYSTVDGDRVILESTWGPGDMFVVPSWAAHEHINSSTGDRAILFSVHDTPLLRALDKHRIEPLAVEHQVVTGEFDGDAP